MKRCLFIIILLILATSATALEIDPELITAYENNDDVPTIVLLKDTVQVNERSNIRQTSRQPQVLSRLRVKTDSNAQFIDKFFPPELQITHRYSTIDGFAGTLSKKGFDKLKNMDEVSAIYLDREVHTTLDTSVPLINATVVFPLKVNKNNLTGKGQTVCIIDTGIDYTHDDLGGCIGSSGGLEYEKAAIICKNSPCIADESLIRSRDHIDGLPEPNQPNTVDACSDGTSGDYLQDESLDRISVNKSTNTKFEPGDTITVNVKTFCYSDEDNLNIVYQNEQRDFEVMHSVNCTGNGFENFNYTFNLDNVEGYHVIRGAFEYNGDKNHTCGLGSYADNDDLVLEVNRPTPNNVQTCKVLGGFDFHNNDDNPFDDHGHGTHVAGIATGNGKITGVAPEANLIAMKVLGSGGSGSTSNVIAGIDWCTNNATKFGISVISMSLGGGAQFNDSSICDANAYGPSIAKATSSGVFVTAASGNDGSSTGLSSPACLTNVTSVGATDDNDNIASFSNTDEILDLLAPGVSINSSVPGNAYTEFQGTSMATPHVAGAAAILYQMKNLEGKVNPLQVRDALKVTNIHPTDSDNGLSFPRIDVLAALRILNSAPTIDDPQIIGVTDSAAVIRIETNEPTNGTFTFNADQSVLTTINLPTSVIHTISLENLTNGTTYLFNALLCDELGLCNFTSKNFTTLSTFNDLTPNTTLQANITQGLEPLHVQFTCSATEGNPPFKYGIKYPQGSILETDFTNATSVMATEVLEAGLHTVNCTVEDIDNDKSSDIVVINVSPDITPPSTVTNLQAADIQTDMITWSWQNPPEPDFNASIIYLDGINVLNTSSNKFTAASLAINSTHIITINTKDHRGNINTTNISNTSTTLPIKTPKVLFLADATQGEEEFEVDFTCLIEQGQAPYDFVIDFGDGKNDTRSTSSTIFNEDHEYLRGLFTANCTVTDNDNFTVTSSNILINVTPDTTPPPSVTDLVASTVNNDSIIWMWEEPFGNNFDFSIIYINGNNVINTSDNQLAAISLESNTSYTITINTVDDFGNINTTNVSNTTRTLANIVNSPPEINSFTPQDLTPVIAEDETQTFTVTLSDPDVGDQLSGFWYVDSQLNATNTTLFTFTPPTITATQSFNITFSISDNLIIVSQSWNLTVTAIPIADNFDGNTTDFTNLSDIENASDVTLEKVQFGSIQFLENLNLSDVTDIDTNAIISGNLAAINTSRFPQLNRSAIITLRGLSYTSTPQIFFNDGFTTDSTIINQPCTFCTILSATPAPTTDGTVVFNVTHFTSFQVVQSSLPPSSGGGGGSGVSETKREELKVSRLNFDEEVLSPGQSLVTRAEIENEGTATASDTKMTVVIPELGLRKRVGPFKLTRSDDILKKVAILLPEDTPPGEYLVRITISSDKDRRVKHRFITVN